MANRNIRLLSSTQLLLLLSLATTWYVQYRYSTWYLVQLISCPADAIIPAHAILGIITNALPQVSNAMLSSIQRALEGHTRLVPTHLSMNKSERESCNLQLQ